MEPKQPPKAALPLLALLALASALGIAVAIALAGVAMLLAAPAYAAPGEVKEGTLLLRARGGEALAAPLLGTEVMFRVSGPVARARVVQTFRNPDGVWTEGIYVFPLWAREKIGALVDSIREGPPEAQVRERVIELASAHRLVTKYTSFVAIDRTPARAPEEPLKIAEVPTLLPEGWEYDKVFGELPRGATDSRLAILSGLLAMLLGLALILRRRPA